MSTTPTELTAHTRSKQVRIEVTFAVLVHVGEDLVEGATPEREPDAVTTCTIARTLHLGPFVGAGDTITAHLPLMGLNTLPTLAERVRHTLALKGL